MDHPDASVVADRDDPVNGYTRIGPANRQAKQETADSG
jgi:hypothetical protein